MNRVALAPLEARCECNIHIKKAGFCDEDLRHSGKRCNSVIRNMVFSSILLDLLEDSHIVRIGDLFLFFSNTRHGSREDARY